MNLRSTIRQYPVTVFIICTFALSVATTFAPVGGDSRFLLLATLLVPIPTIVVLALSAVAGGVRPFLRETLQWGVGWRWVFMVLGIAFAARLLVSLIALLTGAISTVEIGPVAPALVVVIYLFALMEEIGWRGFAVRRLVTKHSPIAAFLITGIPWSAIHIFFYLAQGASRQTVLLVFVLNCALTTLVTWVYLRSGQRLWIGVILHGSQSVFVVLNSSIAPDLSLAYSVVSYSLIALALLAFDWRMWFARPAEKRGEQAVLSVVQ
jgi:membrane protease YdiL (CAAX protease family)